MRLNLIYYKNINPHLKFMTLHINQDSFVTTNILENNAIAVAIDILNNKLDKKKWKNM